MLMVGRGPLPSTGAPATPYDHKCEIQIGAIFFNIIGVPRSRSWTDNLFYIHYYDKVTFIIKQYYMILKYIKCQL